MSVVTSVWDTGGSVADDDVVELSGTTPFWSYLKPPAVPHAHDDYFDNASIAVAWTQGNPGTNMTFSETAAERLKLSQTTHAGDAAGWLVRAAPADNEYNVTLGFRPRGNIVNYSQIGLICGGSDLVSSPTTANYLTAICVLKNVEWFWELDAYADYATFSSTDGTLSDGPFYLIRWHVNISGNRIGMLVSTDGRDWMQINDKILGTAGLAGTNPAFFGPYINNINSGVTLSAVFDMYQVEVTADRFSPVGGWVDLGTV